MAIFRREAESDPSPDRPGGQPSPAVSATHVAPGTVLTGRIEGGTDVVVDGRLDGEVTIDGRVQVGAEGRVEGRLEATVVEVGGRVDGDVRGHERIILTASARLHGDLQAPRVVIEEGAFFKGQVNMSGQRGSRGSSSRPQAGGSPSASAKPTSASTDGGSQ